MKLRFQTILCAAAALSVLAASGCRRPQQENAEGQGQENELQAERTFLSPVLTRTVTRGEVTSAVSATGTVIPVRSQALRTDEAGRLAFERNWTEGDMVEEGELIAIIISETLAREYAINSADIDIQKETMDLGERTLRARLDEYRTMQDLYAKGIAAEREVDAARLELDRARNNQRQNAINLAKAESRLRETENRMERLAIRAPWSGMLVSRATLEGQGTFARGFGEESITDRDGEQIGAGTVICGIVETEEVFVRCDVTARDIGEITPGQESGVTIFAREDITLPGQVARISDSVNPETRAFEVDVLVENPLAENGTDRLLKPGMFGRADIVTERRRDAIALPRSAVTRRNNMDVVFVVSDQTDTGYDVARLTPVELGIESQDEVEITFGLREGDRVVIRGYEVLQDQSPVNAIDADAPATPDTPGTASLPEEPAEEESSS